jgi:Na+-transporting methylmalonyl-CoA/oxaloacetate decarboxylase gamma subunit
MTALESLPYAFFCMAVVFAVLIILCLIIKIFSFAVGSFAGKEEKKVVAMPVPKPIAMIETGPVLSCGELKLHNVDERTAAMIMAIVADDSGIPLEELCFKSIKAKD